jgi:hypothetical protein
MSITQVHNLAELDEKKSEHPLIVLDAFASYCTEIQSSRSSPSSTPTSASSSSTPTTARTSLGR